MLVDIERGSAPPLLARHTVFRTSDPARAEFEGARAMSAHRLRPRDSRFSSELHAVSIGRSSLVYLQFDGAVELRAEAPMEYYTLQLVLAGAMQVDSVDGRARVGPGEACVHSPGEDLTLHFAPGTRQLGATVPAAVVNEAFGRIAGTAGGRDVRFALRAPSASAWAASLELVARSVDRLDSGMPLARQTGEELERMLVTSLLLAQPHDRTAAMGRPTGTRGYRAAGGVAEALRRSPQLPVDFTQAARDAGVGVRTLQQGFAERYGRSPSSYLRDLRLEHAHALLTDATVASVTDAAYRSGFTHAGRFALDYRHRYGVSPSDTLRDSARRRGGCPRPGATAT